MTERQPPLPDARKSWLVTALPAPLRPYARLMRLDRPIGIWLLLLPGWWSLTLAGFGVPQLKLVALFFIGAVAMRGAGCTYNDIVDRDIDAKVARTRSRPLPAGEVSLRAAWIFTVLQLAVGLAVLLQFNRFAILIGASSLVLVAVYPFMKRITFWPQAWLGLTFNWGALTGWAAARGDIEMPALLLYAAGVLWTLGYDTIYAHQDREDDALVGVKSSARALAHGTRLFVAAAYLATILLLLLALRPLPLGWPTRFFLSAAAVQLVWQVTTLKTSDSANCLARFRSNRDFGLLVLAALLLLRY